MDHVTRLPFPGNIPTGRPTPNQARPTLGLPRHFFIGPENRLVQSMVEAVLCGEPSPYSPFVVCGLSGTGKSHLIKGVEWAFGEDFPDRRVVATAARDFNRELANAIDAQATDEFQVRYREAGLVILEDLPFLATKPAAQEELLHILDELRAHDRLAIVTTTRPVARLRELIPPLRARLAAGLTVTLMPPGLEARRAILKEQVKIRRMTIDAALVDRLAQQLPVNVPALLGAVRQLEAMNRMEPGPIDEAMVREVVHSDLRRVPRVSDIAKATAKRFSLKLSELRSSSRRRAIATARGIAMHIARRLTEQSFEQIGRYFGGRDHTTVMHACRKINQLLETDSSVREALEDILAKWGTSSGGG